MTPEQFRQFKDEIQEHIAQTVRVTVNGKIDRISSKLDSYIASDNDWKKRAQPTVDLGTNIRGFGTVVAYVLGVMAAIGAAYYGFKQLTDRI